MTRLRRATPRKRGWIRRRAGRGFSYLDADSCPLPGNTPAIPRVIDRYESGVTIRPTLAKAPRDPAKRQAVIERAVARLLADPA